MPLAGCYSFLSFQDLSLEDNGTPQTDSSQVTTADAEPKQTPYSISDHAITLSQSQLLAISKRGGGVSRTLTLHMYIDAGAGSNQSSALEHESPRLLASVGHTGTAGVLKMLLYTLQSEDNRVGHSYLYPNSSSTDDSAPF